MLSVTHHSKYETDTFLLPDIITEILQLADPVAIFDSLKILMSKVKLVIEHKIAHSQETNIDYAMKIISKKRLIKRSGFLRKPPPRMRNSTGASKGTMILISKVHLKF